jgi:hypothetical protein
MGPVIQAGSRRPKAGLRYAIWSAHAAKDSLAELGFFFEESALGLGLTILRKKLHGFASDRQLIANMAL